MKTTKILGLAGLVFVMAFSAASAQSQDSTKHYGKDGMRGGRSFQHRDGKGRQAMGSEVKHRGHGDKLAGLPGLTEDQQKKIDALKTPFQKDVLTLRNQLAEKKAHLHTLQTADKADLGAINKTIDEITALQSNLMKKSASHHEDIRKLLTDEQKLAFDSRRGHHRGHNGGDRKF